MFKAFWFAAIGTSLGAIVATLLLKDYIPELGKLAGTMTASYVGGGINFITMTAEFNPSEYLVNSTIVADNLVMAGFFFIYMYIPTSKFFRKKFKLYYSNSGENIIETSESENKASEYWAKKEISLKDIAFTISISVVIAAVSSKLGSFMSGIIPTSNFVLEMLNIMLSNQYFLMTLITVTLVAVFSEFFENLAGGQEIGTFLIYLFFVAIGIPASIQEIITNSPLLFVFCTIIAIFNLVFCLLGSKISKNLTLEEAMLAANATVGGPTTAAAMAISKGWNEHVIPALLCGLTGYVTGNFIGLFIGNLLIRLIS